MINVAIVDDHPLYRNGVRDYLTQNDINVIYEAGNGKLFLDLLSRCTILPDICIMDVSMPVMNGYDTTLAVKATYPQVKVIAMSFSGQKYNIVQMVKNGAVSYLFKDDPPDRLLEAVNTVYKYGFYFSEVSDHRLKSILYEVEMHKELSRKDLDFLELVCKDLTYAQIARIMNVSPRTVDGYRDKLFSKLNLNSRAGLALFTVLSGLIENEKLLNLANYKVLD